MQAFVIPSSIQTVIVDGPLRRGRISYLAGVDVASGALTYGVVTASSAPAAAPTTGTKQTRYTRDALGRITNYSEYVAGGTANYSQTDTYNTKSEITSEAVSTLQQDGTTLNATTSYDYTLSTNGSVWNGTTHGTYGSGAYQGGVVTHTLTHNSRLNTNGSTTTLADSETESFYTWWDDAEVNHKGSWPDVSSTVYTSDYTRNAVGGLTGLSRNEASSGQVTYTLDAQGHVSARRETASGSSAVATDYSYFFGGVLLGRSGNNGPDADDYALATGQFQAQPTRSGPFVNGGPQPYANFDESYDPINPESQDQTASRYTVQDGDTLTSIAQAVWGDGSLWYMLADANGLDGSQTLIAGQDLNIPAKVTNIHNNSSTYRVYDPNQAQGPIDPIAPQPKHHNHCGVFGQILLIAVAVAVSVATYGALTGPATSGLAAVEAGAVAGALGSVISQGVGLATGIQDKFSFKGVALSAIAGGVGGGIGPGADIDGSPFLGHVVAGALGDAVTQGIALATGLQSHFSWSEIATAGLADGVGDAVGHDILHVPAGVRPNVGQGLVEGVAGAIAGSAERSLLTGSDFGDNLMRILPSVIGNTIGNLAASSIAGNRAPRLGYADVGTDDDLTYAGGQTGAGDGALVQPQPGEGGGQVGWSASGNGDAISTSDKPSTAITAGSNSGLPAAPETIVNDAIDWATHYTRLDNYIAWADQNDPDRTKYDYTQVVAGFADEAASIASLDAAVAPELAKFDHEVEFALGAPVAAAGAAFLGPELATYAAAEWGGGVLTYNGVRFATGAAFGGGFEYVKNSAFNLTGSAGGYTTAVLFGGLSGLGGALPGIENAGLNRVVSGALSAGTADVSGQTIDLLTGTKTTPLSGKSVLISTLIGGAVGGAIPDWEIEGLNSGRNSSVSIYRGLNTKFYNGNVSSVGARYSGSAGFGAGVRSVPQTGLSAIYQGIYQNSHR